MITHCKETDIAHARQLNELESRLGFQEERGKDARGRLERLEEGERALQVSGRGSVLKAKAGVAEAPKPFRNAYGRP